MRGMLLAAGLGKRLSPLTDERPKPVVPVGLEPLAMDALRTFARAGVSRIDVNAYHLPDVLEAELAPCAPDGGPLFFHRETTLLGTGGGIRAVREGLRDEPVLVMNGDIRFEPDVGALEARHRETNAVATLVVRPHPDPFALGAVEVDSDGFIVRIAGRPEGGRDVHSAYVFTGVHLLSSEVHRWLPESGCIVRKAYQPMLAAGVRLAAVVDAGPWADLGTIPVYHRANLDLASASPDPRGIVHPAAEIHPRAVVEGCIVGAGARVGPNARLRRCIVWSSASADRPLVDAIVTPRTVVAVPGESSGREPISAPDRR